MDGIEGLLARDFGVRPQGKAAPMAGASRSTGSSAGADAWASYGRSTPAPSAAPSYDDLFGASLFDSFKGPTTTTTTNPAAPSPAPAYDDDIFDAVPGLRPSSSASTTASSAPRYDDGVFGSSAAPAYDDVFATSARSAPPPPAYDDDILGGFGSALPQAQAEERRRPVAVDDDGDDLLGAFGRSPSEGKRKPAPAQADRMGSTGFDDLIPGFAGSSPPRSR